LDATDGDGNFDQLEEDTLTAESPIQPQPGGASAITLYNPQSDPATGSNSSSSSNTDGFPPGLATTDPIQQPSSFSLSLFRARQDRDTDIRMQQVRGWKTSLDRILASSSSTDNLAYLPSGEHTIQIPQPMLQTAITPSVRNDLIVGVTYLCILALEYICLSASIDEEETAHQKQSEKSCNFQV
jgi:hypothetical protein